MGYHLCFFLLSMDEDKKNVVSNNIKNMREDNFFYLWIRIKKNVVSNNIKNMREDKINK